MTHIFSLQKLTIVQIDPITLQKKLESFEVMFNPKSYQETYGVEVDATAVLAGGEILHYIPSSANTMDFELVFDGSKAELYPWQQILSSKTVEQRIDRLFKVAGYPPRSDKGVSKINPLPLQVSWGRLAYQCILQQVKVDYSQFDRDGKPTRATLNTTFRLYNPPQPLAATTEQTSGKQTKPKPTVSIYSESS
ncbi:MAG: hypothetical protein ACI8WB_001019 [Phenylobacterium sp.]|jgi:hypothetical protein